MCFKFIARLVKVGYRGYQSLGIAAGFEFIARLETPSKAQNCFGFQSFNLTNWKSAVLRRFRAFCAESLKEWTP